MINIITWLASYLAKKRVLIGAIFVFGLVLGLYIPLIPSDPTPADGASFILASYRLGQPHLPYPIYTLLGFLFTKLPWSSIAARVTLLSTIAGAGSICLIYLLIYRFLTAIFKQTPWNNMVAQVSAILAALSLAFCNRFWNASVTSEQYALNILALLSILVLAINWEKNGNMLLIYAASLIYGLSLGLHYLNIMYMPIFVLFVITSRHRRKILRFKSIAIITLVFCLGLLQFLYVYFRPIGPFSDIKSIGDYWTSLIEPEMRYSLSGPNIIESLSLERLKVAFSVSFVDGFWSKLVTFVFAALGVFGLVKYKPRVAALLVAIFLVNRIATLPNVGRTYGLGGLEFWLLPSTVILTIFVGTSAIVFYRGGNWFRLFLQSRLQVIKFRQLSLKIPIKQILPCTLILFISSLAFITCNNYLLNRFQRLEEKTAANNLKIYSKTLLEYASPDGIIVTDWTFGTSLFYYQKVDKINADITIVSLWPDDWANYITDWLTVKPIYTTHIDPVVFKELPVVRLFQHDWMTAYRTLNESDYLPQNMPPIQHPSSYNLSNIIEFIGYDLDKVTIKPGQSFRITYYWQALTPIEQDYKVFVHFVSESGEIEFQQDHYPVDGIYPTTEWQVGDIIRESYVVIVPSNVEPGSYRINIGMWDPIDSHQLVILGDNEQSFITILDELNVIEEFHQQ